MGVGPLGAEAKLTLLLPAAAAQGWEGCGQCPPPPPELSTPSLSASVPAYQMGQ